MSEAPAMAPPLKEDPEKLVLRGRPRPAVRFRRGLIVGLSGTIAAGIVTFSWFALDPPVLRQVQAPLGSDDDTAAKPGANALADVPQSYGDVPRLGPPLPGDLGRPILDEERRTLAEEPGPASAAHDVAEGQNAADLERQRADAAVAAARSSPVSVALSTPPAMAVPAEEAAAAPAGSSAGDSAFNPHSLHAPSSPWTISAGAIIPASLVTGLDSDLPGTVIAQVTENVRDSATGRTVLVPQGARLIGTYDSAVAYGQRRVLLVWERLVLPDGSSLELDKLPASDVAGFTGVADQVDSHGWQLFKGVVLSTLLGVGTELGLDGSGEELVRALRESAQQNAAHAGDQITARNLDVHPTITVRPGWPVRVIVNKDMVLWPWRG